jgi:hypothetical protein
MGGVADVGAAGAWLAAAAPLGGEAIVHDAVTVVVQVVAQRLDARAREGGGVRVPAVRVVRHVGGQARGLRTAHAGRGGWISEAIAVLVGVPGGADILIHDAVAVIVPVVTGLTDTGVDGVLRVVTVRAAARAGDVGVPVGVLRLQGDGE